MSLVGKKVKVTFRNWPIPHATYVYEGRDETGYFLRRKDGTQRHMLFEFVASMVPTGEEIAEGEY